MSASNNAPVGRPQAHSYYTPIPGEPVAGLGPLEARTQNAGSKLSSWSALSPSPSLVGSAVPNDGEPPRVALLNNPNRSLADTPLSTVAGSAKKTEETAKPIIAKTSRKERAAAEKKRKEGMVSTFLQHKITLSRQRESKHRDHKVEKTEARDLSEVDSELFVDEKDLKIDKKFKKHIVTADLAVKGKGHLPATEEGLVKKFSLDDGTEIEGYSFEGEINPVVVPGITPTSFSLGIPVKVGEEEDPRRGHLENAYLTRVDGQIVIRSGKIDSKKRADDFLALIRKKVANDPNLKKPFRIVSQQLNSFERERKIIDGQHRWIAYVNQQLKRGDSPVDAEVIHINIPSNRWYHATRSLESLGWFGAMVKAILPKKVFGMENLFQGEKLSRQQNFDSWGSYTGWVAQDVQDELLLAGTQNAEEFQKKLKRDPSYYNFFSLLKRLELVQNEIDNALNSSRNIEELQRQKIGLQSALHESSERFFKNIYPLLSEADRVQFDSLKYPNLAALKGNRLYEEFVNQQAALKEVREEIETLNTFCEGLTQKFFASDGERSVYVDSLIKYAGLDKESRKTFLEEVRAHVEDANPDTKAGYESFLKSLPVIENLNLWDSIRGIDNRSIDKQSFLTQLNAKLKIHVGSLKVKKEASKKASKRAEAQFLEQVYPFMSDDARAELSKKLNRKEEELKAGKPRLTRYGNLNVEASHNIHQQFDALSVNQRYIKTLKSDIDDIVEEIEIGKPTSDLKKLHSDLHKQRKKLKALLIQDYESFRRIEKILSEGPKPKQTEAFQKISLMRQVLGSQLGFKSARLERGKEGMAIQLLNEKLGIVSALNCKSGLDRTGIWHAVKLAMSKVSQEDRYVLVDEWEAVTNQMNQISARLAKKKMGPINEWLNQDFSVWKKNGLLPKKMKEAEFDALLLKMASVIQFRKNVLDNLIRIGIPITTASTGVMGFKWNSGRQENLIPLNFLPTHVKKSGTDEVMSVIKYKSGAIAGMSNLGRTFLTMFQKLRGS